MIPLRVASNSMTKLPVCAGNAVLFHVRPMPSTQPVGVGGGGAVVSGGVVSGGGGVNTTVTRSAAAPAVACAPDITVEPVTRPVTVLPTTSAMLTSVDSHETPVSGVPSCARASRSSVCPTSNVVAEKMTGCAGAAATAMSGEL